MIIEAVAFGVSLPVTAPPKKSGCGIRVPDQGSLLLPY
jgi:hypothetical protein